MSTDASIELSKIHSAAFKHDLGKQVAFAKGLFTTAGGDVNEVIPVTDLEVGDIVMVMVATKGAVPVTIVEAIAAAGQIEIELSADPSNDHVLSYLVFKA